MSHMKTRKQISGLQSYKKQHQKQVHTLNTGEEIQREVLSGPYTATWQLGNTGQALGPPWSQLLSLKIGQQ